MFLLAKDHVCKKKKLFCMETKLSINFEVGSFLEDNQQIGSLVHIESTLCLNIKAVECVAMSEPSSFYC